MVRLRIALGVASSLVAIAALITVFAGTGEAQGGGSGPNVFVTNTPLPVTGNLTATIPGNVNATVTGGVSIVNTPTVNANISGDVGIVGTPTVNVGNTATNPVLVRDVDRMTEAATTPVTATAECFGNAPSETLLFTFPASQTFKLTDVVIGLFGNATGIFHIRQPPFGAALELIPPVNQTLTHRFGTPIVFHGFNGDIKMGCPSGALVTTVTITGTLE